MCGAAESEPGSVELSQVTRHTVWECAPDPALPNVLIVGDSISISYTPGVRDLLQGKANVFRPVMYDSVKQKYTFENGGDTEKGLRRIKDWLSVQGTTKWDVIHFNWGLHDLKRISKEKGNESDDPSVPPVVPVEKYRENLEQLVTIMKSTGAVLIFGTTTPYVEGVLPCRIPEDAIRYNEAAREVMKKHGVVVNDLYSAVLPHLGKLQQPVNVHFKPEGAVFLAEKVADMIARYLPAENQMNRPDNPLK
jgi:acyl-CoA thioesterase-1